MIGALGSIAKMVLPSLIGAGASRLLAPSQDQQQQAQPSPAQAPAGGGASSGIEF